MSRFIDKEIVISHKKAAIKRLNLTLEKYINSNDSKKLKKADLISYWIETYSSYIEHEASFDYQKIMRYTRGDIIQVNFGFNVGSEQGGLHYAVVLDNNNQKSSPVVTVIPLSSGSERDAHSRDIYLGNELYEKVKTKYDKLKSKIQKDSLSAQHASTIISILHKMAQKEPLGNDISKYIQEHEDSKTRLEEELRRLEIYKKEIEKLKRGSIALMEQITTVSKMRIYQPKSSDDLLYGVRYSTPTMDKINERLKELFVFSK